MAIKISFHVYLYFIRLPSEKRATLDKTTKSMRCYIH